MANQKLLVLLTGANQGLGYYAAKQLSLSGKYHVLLGSRDISKAEDAIRNMSTDDAGPSSPENVEPIQIDVNSDTSVQKAAQIVEQKYGYLDILMNNAGISRAAGQHDDRQLNEDGSGPSLREQYQQLFDTNVFGSAVVIDTFLPLLRKSTKPGGKRIAFTGSGTASLELARTMGGGLHGKNYRVYRSSKTAINMVMVSYARELEDEGFVVSASNPGYCATNLNQHRGMRDPRDGAKELIHAIELPKKEAHGRLVSMDEPVPW